MDPLRLLSRSSGLRLNKVSQHQVQPLPSAGGNTKPIVHNGTDSGGRKRSREEFEETECQDLNEAEIRKIHKQHKVKITDLKALHRQTKPRAGMEQQNRKASKEAARLYPQPLQTFSQLRQLGIGQALIRNIAQQAYREPTEVQMATIPLLLRSDEKEPDLLAVAPTGSGKTLAFLVPLIDKIARVHRQQKVGDKKYVGALVLAPTKELAGQIVNEGRKLAAGTGVRITEMRKGMQIAEAPIHVSDEDPEIETDDEPQGKQPAVKADVLVATPLSLVNSITRSDSTIIPLPSIHTLILDEADYLLDTLFREQVMAIWTACTSTELRVSLWSATIGSSIEDLAIATIMSRYSKRSKQSRPLLRIIIGLKDTSLPTISHKLTYALNEPGKLMGLRQLLHPASTASGSRSESVALRPPFLVFTQTITRAASLYDEIKYDIPASAGGSSRIAVLHSELSNPQRAQTMTEFRQGKIWILITTDLLSRGVDFRGVNGVVNYDIPTTAASYVHRAGRTGRAGREGGICVTFYTREDIKYLKPIANLIRASRQKSSSTSSKDDARDENGVPSWLLSALPELSKQDRKDLKQRGVNFRRAVKESDSKEDRRKKGKNRIGTSSGYERRLADRTKGMIEGSRRRKERAPVQEDSDDEGAGFQGFGD